MKSLLRLREKVDAGLPLLANETLVFPIFLVLASGVDGEVVAYALLLDQQEALLVYYRKTP